jgi:hypothetical protein
MKYLLTILFLIPVYANCQPATTITNWIPPRDSLQAALTNYYNLKLEADLEEFRFSEKYRALKYVPQIGFDWVLFRPIIGFNSNLIYQVANDRQLRAAKIRAIEKANELDRAQAAIQLDLMILSLENRINHFRLWEEGKPIREQLKALVRARYRKGEITPREYLTHELSWQEEVRRDSDFRYELTRTQIQILEVAKVGPQIH